MKDRPKEKWPPEGYEYFCVCGPFDFECYCGYPGGSNIRPISTKTKTSTKEAS